MNLFYTNRDPQLCAQDHCDKHVVKMIVEYAQLLSTAHRVLDGKHQVVMFNGRRQQQWVLPTADANENVYKASHVNHPAAIWCRQSPQNYKFLYDLYRECCTEYTHRYGKVHATQRLDELLSQTPTNIPAGEFVDPPLSMPDEYKADDAVISYQNLYVGSKARFAKWTNRLPPQWFIQRIPNYDQTNFERTRHLAA